MAILTLADLRKHLSPFDPGKSTLLKNRVLALHSLDATAQYEIIQNVINDVDVLIYGNEDTTWRSRLGVLRGARGELLVRLIRGGKCESYCLFSASMLNVTLFDAVLKVAKEFAVSISVRELSDSNGKELIIALPRSGGIRDRVSLDPRLFIHDGTRHAEVNADYSWLWIGSERHLRILLGVIPQHFKRLRIVVANAHASTNLRNAKMMLNGIRVQNETEVWNDGVGAASIQIPDQEDTALVVGFSVPPSSVISKNGIALAACIDKVELFS